MSFVITFVADNGTDLVDVAPEVGGPWDYAGAAATWQSEFDGATTTTNLAGDPLFAKLTPDFTDRDFELKVFGQRSAVAGDTVRVGVWALGKGQLGEGICAIAQGSGVTLNLHYQRRDAAGALVEDVQVATGHSWPTSSGHYIGLEVDAEGAFARVFTEDAAGANRVYHGSPQAIPAALLDGLHKKLGLVNFRTQSSMRFFMYSFTYVGPPLSPPARVFVSAIL